MSDIEIGLSAVVVAVTAEEPRVLLVERGRGPASLPAGLLDAVPIIGVAIALLLIFANPFLAQLAG